MRLALKQDHCTINTYVELIAHMIALVMTALALAHMIALAQSYMYMNLIPSRGMMGDDIHTC